MKLLAHAPERRSIPSPARIEGAAVRLRAGRRRALTLLELTMTLGIFALIVAASMTFYGQAQKARMERSGIVATAPSIQPQAAPAPIIVEAVPERPASSVAQSSSLGKLLVATAAISGILMLAVGLLKLKAAAECEGLGTPYSDGLWRMVVGAGLVALPAVVAIVGAPSTGIGALADGKAQYASTPARQPKVSNVDVGLHDLAQKLDAMQLSETCPGDEFSSQSCATVGGYLVRRDMNGTISVSLLTRTAGGRPVANEVLRVVGSEPYLSNEIAARDLDAVKKQLIRTFMSR